MLPRALKMALIDLALLKFVSELFNADLDDRSRALANKVPFLLSIGTKKIFFYYLIGALNV